MSSNFRNSIKAIVSRRTAYIQITPDTKFIEGLIVRITAEELHIQDVGFLDAVYAPSASPRNKCEYQLRTLRVLEVWERQLATTSTTSDVQH